MKKTLNRFILFLENSSLNFSGFLVTFLSLIVARLLIEHWLGGFEYRPLDMIFIEFSHTFLFFLFSYMLFVWLFVIYLGVPLVKASSILLWGFCIILVPPIIDHIVSHGEGFWSFYKFDGVTGLIKRYFTFFGDHPEIGITYGVRTEVAIAVIGCALYAFVKTKRKVKVLLFAIIVYSLFFFLGTLPSWFTLTTTGFSRGFLNITPANVAQDFISPVRIFGMQTKDMVNSLGIRMSIILALLVFSFTILVLVQTYRKPTLAFLKNTRPPQLIYHAGLFCLGVAFAVIFAHSRISIDVFHILSFALMLVAIVCAWVASVIVNDIYDQKIDVLTNTHRPLIRGEISPSSYALIGVLLFLISLFFSAIIFPPTALFLIAYQAIAWIYSAPPFRLKRFPVLASALSAIASILILLLGYFLAASRSPLSSIPSSILIFLTFAYTVSLPLKDFKDLEGDKKDGVWTIPVLLGEYQARLLIASVIFFCFLLSVLVLNEPRLWVWAFLFGSGSAWTILTNASLQKFSIKNKDLPWALLFWVTLYGLLITDIFFK